jgi:hypothetical protein
MASKRKVNEENALAEKRRKWDEEQRKLDWMEIQAYYEKARLKRIEQLKKVALAMASGKCDCGDSCNGWQCHCELTPCVCAPVTCLGKELGEAGDQITIVLSRHGREYKIKF